MSVLDCGLRRGAAAEGIARPQLTSLVDALTILLVFLLKSFSTEGSLITPAAEIDLPASASRERPRPTVSIEITPAHLAVEGETIAALPAIAAGDALLIAPLRDRLAAIAANGGAPGAEHEVTIQCDRRIDFAVVKRVLFTCAQAEFDDFSLLVLQSEES